jgi:hypothetical protein
MTRKAQVGLELIAALAIIFLILIVITVYSIEKVQESNDIKTFIDAKRICTSIADNLDTIQQQGKGHYKYFSMPEQIQGNYDYNVSIGNNAVEITWGDRSWVVGTIASNITVYCLDYGLNESNRVWNKGDYLAVSCYRPNLRPLEESVRYWNNEGNVTISVKVENEGHVYSQGFNVSFGSDDRHVDGLEAYEKIELNHTIEDFPTGGYTVVIKADSWNAVEESIETDNTVNETITI